MSKDQHPLASPTLLSLFRSELETHTAAIEKGLSAAEAGAPVAEADTMLAAAHAIKGAASIVKLDIASSLAQALVSQLGTLPQNTAADSSVTTAIRSGIGLLTQIRKLADNETADEFNALRSEVDDFISSLGIAEPSSPEKRKTTVIPAQPIAVDKGTADPVMLGLFMTELETHTGTLNDGLLALEDDPSQTDHIASLMRAAHSIKGAARVVNIDLAVSLAHSMEDLFVAVQDGALQMDSAKVELLFQGTDMLSAIGSAMSQGDASKLSSLTSESGNLTAALAAERKGESASPTTRVVKRRPERQAQGDMPAAPGNRESVRVSADNLDNIMNLAGEIMVNGRRMHSFRQTFRDVDRQFTGLGSLASELQRNMDDADDALQHRTANLVQEFSQLRAKMAAATSSFEGYASGVELLSTRMHQEAIASRMRPFSEGVRGFPRMVRDIAKSVDKKVSFKITGQNTDVDRDILQQLDPPITHLLRNAIDHGIEAPAERKAAGKPEAGTLTLDAVHHAGQLLVTVTDNGRGIDHEMLRKKIVTKKLTDEKTASQLSNDELLQFMFLPGFSTASEVTELSGRGVGLDIVQDMMQAVGGSVHTTTTKGEGTSVRLTLPITRSVLPALVFEVAGECYAFPLTQIDCCALPEKDQLSVIDGIRHMAREEEQIPIIHAGRVLGLEASANGNAESQSVIVISNSHFRAGLVVDRYLGEQILVIRPLDPRLGPCPCVASTSVMDDGAAVLILDTDDTIHFTQNSLLGSDSQSSVAASAADTRKRVLIVDDSETIRESERRILEGAGYRVESAVDGMDGWNALTARPYDLVISDVDMPRMNGLELVERMRKDSRFAEMPVIIVSYKDRPEDRERGIEAGADMYMTKSSLNDNSILKSAQSLLSQRQ